jgi:predicted ATPase
MDKISIKGFKGFQEKVEIELKKFTIIFGYNNSGKSALLRAIPLLSDSFKDHSSNLYTHSYLDYNSDSLRGAIHSDILNANSRELEFRVDWRNFGISFSLRQNALESEFVHKFELTKNEINKNYLPSEDAQYIFEKADEENILLKSFFGISDIDIREKIQQTSHSVNWLSSIRTAPPRTFDIGLGVQTGINFKGDGIGETLWYLKDNCSSAFDLINTWLNETTNRRLKLDSSSIQNVSSGKATVKLQTTNAENEGEPVDIIDSGEGIAQALPVVTLCSMAKFGLLGTAPVIAIEQPELHLHPQAIITLAEFLIDIIKTTENVKLVIETHSESFLLAIQSAIVKREILNNELSCYWIEKENNVSTVSNITFDDDGYIQGNWPQSVFREIISQSKELLKAREDKE